MDRLARALCAPTCLAWLAACSAGAPEPRAAAAAAAAPPARMVKDVATGSAAARTPPVALTPLGAVLLFVSGDAALGPELWSTDATAGGTAVVRDLFPGSPGGMPVGPELAPLGAGVVFAATDGSRGLELWWTDGTFDGTRLVKELRRGPAGASPRGLVPVGAEVWFAAEEVDFIWSLWRTDGTEGGTARAASGFDRAPEPLGALGDAVLFAADGKLWRASAAAEGAAVLASLTDGSPADLWVGGRAVVLDGAAYLTASDARAASLWRTDGTPQGTAEVWRAAAATVSGSPTAIAVSGGSVYFVAPSSGSPTLFRWDGAAAVPLASAVGGAPLVPFGERLYFGRYTPEAGRELWVTDGAATALLKDVNPGAANANPYPSPVVVAAGGLWFGAHDASGLGLWRSDGTSGGTSRVATLPAAPEGPPGPSGPTGPTGPGGGAGGTEVVGEIVPFGAGVAFQYGSAGSVWVSDGTEAGTRPVSADETGASSSPIPLGVAAGALVLSASDGLTGREPWRSDGTADGTRLLWDANTLTPLASSDPAAVAALGPDALLLALSVDPYGPEPWLVDGLSPGGTFLDVFQGVGGSRPSRGAALGGVAVFAASGVGTGAEPWRSDGTPAGTFLLKDVVAGFGGSYPRGFVAGPGGVWFVAANGAWVTDGTAEGTRRVGPASLWADAAFAAAGPRVYFDADSPSGGEIVLWTSDGTGAGTAPLAVPGRALTRPGSLTPFGDGLVFSAREGDASALWRTDGTGAGTTLLAAVAPFRGAVGPAVNAGGIVFFSANDGVHGFELWRTDGTAAGTAMVADLYAGPVGGVAWPRPAATDAPPTPAPFVAVPELGQIVFAGADAAGGLEPWASDGTPEGTRRLQDVWPGPGSSSPAGFTRVGDVLCFAAHDGAHGRELWSLPILALDLRAPVLACPAAVAVEAAGDTGAVATFEATATDDLSAPGAIAIAYSQAPGTTFPPGATTVTVTATDEAGNAATCAFDVTVGSPEPPPPEPPAPAGGGCGSAGGAGGLALLGLAALRRRRG